MTSTLSSIAGNTNTERERSVAARVGVERRDAHQAMNPDLGLQVAVGVFAIDLESRALDAGAFAGLQIGDIDFETAPFGPSQVQPQQHLGPVLRLHAAGAWVNRDNRAEAIVLAAEHHLQLMLFQFGARGGERGLGLARGLGIVGALFFGHLKNRRARHRGDRAGA